MVIKIPFFKITVTFISLRKARVLKDLKTLGKIRTIKNYMSRYKCGLGPAVDYVRSVEGDTKCQS